MSPERLDPDPAPGSVQIPCNVTCKGVVDLFLELFQLLEDYSPVWYREELRNRALDARSVLKKASGNRVSRLPS